MKANCFYCNVEFECRGAEKYCSKECRKLARLKRDNSWQSEPKTCPYCKKKFYPKHRNDQIYCSEKCRDKAKWENKKTILEERTCPVCGVIFMPTRNKQVCCSPKCTQRKIYLENPEKHREQSRQWRQNNIERCRENDRRKRETNKEKYQQYDQDYKDRVRFDGQREITLKRDGYKCVLCGSTENLAVHHIDGSGQSDKPNNAPGNLITVCSSCHTLQHNPRYDTTPHQINHCLSCGKEIRVSQVRLDGGRGKFCGKECADKAKETSTAIVCQHCGKEFQVTPSRLKRGKVKYCSMECRKAAGYAWTGKK